MAVNDKKFLKVKRLARGFLGASMPSTDPGDPRHYRQSAPLMNDRIVGSGLALGKDGKVGLRPDENTLLDAALAADAVSLEAAVERLSDATGLSRRIFIDTAGVDITTGTETSLFSDGAYMIPGGTLIGDRRLVIRLLGYARCTATSKSFQLIVNLGGSAIYDDSFTNTFDAESRPMEISVTLAALGSGVSQKMWGSLALGNAASITAGEGGLGTPYRSNAISSSDAALAVDMTVDQPVDVRVKLNAATGTHEVHVQYAYMEVV